MPRDFFLLLLISNRRASQDPSELTTETSILAMQVDDESRTEVGFCRVLVRSVVSSTVLTPAFNDVKTTVCMPLSSDKVDGGVRIIEQGSCFWRQWPCVCSLQPVVRSEAPRAKDHHHRRSFYIVQYSGPQNKTRLIALFALQWPNAFIQS